MNRTIESYGSFFVQLNSSSYLKPYILAFYLAFLQEFRKTLHLIPSFPAFSPAKI